MTKKIYLETLKKCSGSLHFPLLVSDLCMLFTPHKIHLFLKFLEIDEISVNPFHDDNESARYIFENFKKS